MGCCSPHRLEFGCYDNVSTCCCCSTRPALRLCKVGCNGALSNHLRYSNREIEPNTLGCHARWWLKPAHGLVHAGPSIRITCSGQVRVRGRASHKIRNVRFGFGSHNQPDIIVSCSFIIYHRKYHSRTHPYTTSCTCLHKTNTHHRTIVTLLTPDGSIFALPIHCGKIDGAKDDSFASVLHRVGRKHWDCVDTEHGRATHVLSSLVGPRQRGHLTMWLRSWEWWWWWWL